MMGSVLNSLLAEARHEAVRSWLGSDGPCRVKLCGVWTEYDVQSLNEVMPDMMGFVTGFPKSHRNVEPTRLMRLTTLVDERIYRCAVIVDMDLDRAGQTGENLVDILQLHGNEDEDYIKALRTRTRAGIVQAFRIRERADVERALRSSADMILLDAGQGSGQRFDWDLLEGVDRPYILAGGLTPENVGEAISSLHPWGVDLSTGIESHGSKDSKKMAAAVAAVRNA